MARAFAVLQEQREEGGQPVVSQANWNQMVRLVQPDISNAHRELLWSVADDKNQGYIGGSPNQMFSDGYRPSSQQHTHEIVG